jgi:hypothetical protein
MNSIRYIEMHDAQVRAISVLAPRTVVIDFNHLPIFMAEEESSQERLWSYQAVLEVRGVRALSSDVVVAEDNWVADGSADADGVDDPNDFSVYVGEFRPCSQLLLEFVFGTKLRLDCEQMTIRLGAGTVTDELWLDGKPVR